MMANGLHTFTLYGNWESSGYAKYVYMCIILGAWLVHMYSVYKET